jgi:hypothetical protein
MSSGHISLMLVVGLVVFACGGSASETPPPLEPDLALVPKSAPASNRYVVVTPRKRHGNEQNEPALQEPGDAPSTWGREDADAGAPER